MLPRSIILLYALLALPAAESIWFPTSRRVDMNFTELVQFDGYDSEWHHVITKDGYVLSIFRVLTRGPCNAGAKYGETSVNKETGVHGRGEDDVRNKTYIAEKIEVGDNMHKESEKKIPILISHGMYLSGDSCVIPGPHKAHCYLYADACHDVWVYNARGSRYSRRHVTLDPDVDSEYWNFAFDEMALFDLPATIDFILSRTKQKQIAFVGHSQGAAILMVLCAKQPKYNDKIKIGFALSPITSLAHSRFINVKVEAHLSKLLPWMERTGTHFEVFAYGRFTQRLSRFLCGRTKLSYPFCSALIFSLIGYNDFNIGPEVLPVFFGHLPSGTSAKNYLRWGQTVRNGFSEYDYGEEDNLVKYGAKKPPLFDLSKVTMEWVLIWSTNDYIADLEDVANTAAHLPHVQKCVLSDRTVGHVDFIFGKTVVKYIVPMILTRLDENTFICL